MDGDFMTTNHGLTRSSAEPHGGTGRYEHIGALFRAAQQGDRSALTELVRMLTPMLWQVARAQGLDRMAAADVVQTAWLQLVSSFSSIRDPVAGTAWLITVTKREAWLVRKAQRAERIEEGAVFERQEDGNPGPAERAAADDLHNRLWAAVDQLPENCRILLRVVAYAPHPHYAEIAEAMGMPIGSIGPTRGRCLVKLRELLMSDQDGGFGALI
jgi:RNA polymerase sigma factor (sigma-70 family)